MKKGVSLVIVIIAISVMLILISAAAVVGSGAIASANFDEYISVLSRMSDNVNEYYVQNNILPVTKQVVSADSLGNEFSSALSKKGDLEERLYVVDMNKITDSTVKFGRGTIDSKDVFVVTENTHNVYYLKGMNYRSNIYFSM